MILENGELWISKLIYTLLNMSLEILFNSIHHYLNKMFLIYLSFEHYCLCVLFVCNYSIIFFSIDAVIIDAKWFFHWKWCFGKTRIHEITLCIDNSWFIILLWYDLCRKARQGCKMLFSFRNQANLDVLILWFMNYTVIHFWQGFLTHNYSE